LNKEEWEEYLQTLSIPFDVNRWGSAQYSGAVFFYDLFFEIRNDLSFEDTLEVLNCKVSFSTVVEQKNAIEGLKAHIVEDFQGILEEDKALHTSLEASETIPDIFAVLRMMSFDLWSAAPFVADYCFEDLDREAPIAPGIGPIYNKLAQSENFETGLCCAILKEFGFVKDDECFSGFDT